MSDYRFALGDLVCFRGASPLKRPESFEITAQMPPRDGVVQYKIKNVDEKFERVVQEDDIDPIPSDRPANSNIPAHLRS